jgi:hypothetical protein
MGYQSLSLLKTCSVIMTLLGSYESLSLLKTRSYQPHLAALWVIHSLIHSSFRTVPRVKYSSLWAKIPKIFSNIDLIEGYHISKIGVCIYLSCLTIKETTVRIWYMVSNIHQGLRKNPKIMKKFPKVDERSTNNHKYRLFLILPYLSCKGQPNMLHNRICFSYNFLRSLPNWTK